MFLAAYNISEHVHTYLCKQVRDDAPVSYVEAKKLPTTPSLYLCSVIGN